MTTPAARCPARVALFPSTADSCPSRAVDPSRAAVPPNRAAGRAARSPYRGWSA